MTATQRHNCRPLHVAGVLRATCQDHYWQTPVGSAAPKPATEAGRDEFPAERVA